MVGIPIYSACISIHALLAESDQARHENADDKSQYFYPRSPCGERLRGCSFRPPPQVISIHALLAESDRCEFHRNNGKIISIHALLAESDSGR